jgi:diguanylate cyclase (GGDEF)-like protein
MSQQLENRNHQLGLFLNPVAQRRVDFQAACGKQFGRLFLAEDAAQAAHILTQQQIGVLVIDLEGFDRGLDGAALGALVAQRHGLPVLLVCRYDAASWLAGLMAFGPLDYVLGPSGDAELNARLGTIGAAGAASPGAADGAGLLALRSRFQQAVVDVDDQLDLAARACAALCDWPGVLHAAMFQRSDSTPPELVLAAQCSKGQIDKGQIDKGQIDLSALLGAGGPLSQSPSRHSFPGLVAAFTGEFACLDAPEKAGDPALASALGRIGVAMVVGVPILARGPGAPLGALCLMFERARALSRDELLTLADLAQLAGFGLRMAETQRDGETLLARLTDIATTDALTGVANRRRGEALLEQEIKRARRYKAPLALIAFDIDHFKGINDRYGHPCGDAALRIVGETTHGQLRTSDLLARTGGDEFQIVATHTNAIDALKMAEKIRATIAATAFPGCDRLTVSLAVAQVAGEESADALMLRVNAALARAKRAGRNCVELAMQ